MRLAGLRLFFCKLMRKEDIFKAVLRQMAMKGPEALSLSDVADFLGCRKQSLYSHFKSKDEMIEKSLEYAGANIEIPGLRVDFRDSADGIFRQMARFYVEIFRDGAARDYLSVVHVLAERRPRARIGIDDISYMIETQSFLILNELSERGRMRFGGSLDYLSHLIALDVIDIISGACDDDRVEFEIDRLARFVKSFELGENT